MAKRTRSSRQGQSGDPRKRVTGEPAQAQPTPKLEEEVEAALELGHPVALAMLASALLAGLDVGASGPTPDRGDLPRPAEFVRMFLTSDDPRLQVLGWTVAQLLPDARLRAEVAATVPPGAVPAWLRPLAEAEVVAAWQTTDPLRDSTDVGLSLRVGDADLSVIGLIDFNSDGALADGFAVPASLAEVQRAVSSSGESGLVDQRLAPADARGWLSEAIVAGRDADPPFESDSWPQARPLLEWALRLCPEGGRGWRRKVWTPAEVEQVVADFAATPAGGVVADPVDAATLADALLVLGRETYGDPQLLSAVKLEMGLGYVWATGLDHALDQLLTLPDLLGPYVRWAHAQRGIPADDTDEALAVIAHRRAEFVRDVAEALGGTDS